MTPQEESNIPVTPRKRRWWLWLIASPFLLFLLVIILLYLPPIQRFAVDKASAIASQSTGLNISVGRLALRFPLDLVVSDVLAVDTLKNDTLLSLERLKVELRFWKLLKKEIEIEEISIRNATIDTRDFFDEMGINGHLGELFLESHGVIFSPETARINEFYVKNSDLEITLGTLSESDTTATEPVYWKILLDQIDIENVGLALRMPQDSLYLRTQLPSVSLRNGEIDLKESTYFVKTMAINEANLSYDSGVEAGRLHPDSIGKTLNTNHLSFKNIDLQIDSVYYAGRDIRAKIARFDWIERSGLELLSTEGRIWADANTINIPQFVMKTTDSSLDLQTQIGWDVLDLKKSGVLSARLLAEIGKGDMLKVVGGMDPEFIKSYPSQPLRILTGVDGDLNRLHLRTFSAELPRSFKVEAEGDLVHLTDSTR